MSKRFNIKDELEKLYIEIPKALLYEKKYKPDKANNTKGLSNDAKLLYGVLLDRTYLSIHTATEKGDTTYIDENGDIFIYFELASIEEILNVATKKAIATKRELISFNLLEEVKIGQGKDTRLYLNIVETNKENLKAYTSSFTKKVKEKKKNEETRIANLREKKNSQSLENALYCQKDSTSTVKKEVQVLSKNQISNTDISNTDFSDPNLKSVVVINGIEKEMTIEYKIQIDDKLTIDEKINSLSKLIFMSEETKALMYRFIKFNLLVSIPQIKMLNDCVYDVASKALDSTIAKNGKSFSYFYEIYVAKEEEDMENLANDFIFMPNFKHSFEEE